MSLSKHLRRLIEISWRDRVLLAEAACALTAASIAIRMMPFRKVVDAAGTGGPVRPENGAGTSAEISRVRWAIEAWARRLPWRVVCFQKGLALHKLLQRRGIASLLHYGVAQDAERGLTAHVWVTYGGKPIIGGDVAADYACLATYPTAAQR